MQLKVYIENMVHPREKRVLMQDISFEMPPGEFVSIVGPSGAGKTTLLRIVAGLEGKFRGRISLGEREITQPSRQIQIVFQDYRLLPWKRVNENLRFAAKDIDQEIVQQRIREWLSATELDGLGSRWPMSLSGGETARVAFARSFIDPPKVLLLDEPFTGLDIPRRRLLQEKLQEALNKNQTTVLLVSHAVEDAVFLSDSVFVVDKNPMRITHTFQIGIRRPRQRTDSELRRISDQITKCLIDQAHDYPHDPRDKQLRVQHSA